MKTVKKEHEQTDRWSMANANDYVWERLTRKLLSHSS